MAGGRGGRQRVREPLEDRVPGQVHVHDGEVRPPVPERGDRRGLGAGHPGDVAPVGEGQREDRGEDRPVEHQMIVRTVGTATRTSSNAGMIVQPISKRLFPWTCFGKPCPARRRKRTTE